MEVTLQVTYPDGTVNTVTTITDGSGLYSFGNLLLDEDHGIGGSDPVYQVFVDTPSGYLPTSNNVGGDDTADSDGSGTTASPITGADDDTNDFGFVGAGAIGNRIWIDENSDGLQDAGETGIPNVEVRLYNSTGTLVGTTYTDPDGGYLFDNLLPGDYFVDVLDGTGGTATSMAAGLTQTPPSTLTNGDFGNQDHGTTAIPSSALFGYAVTIGGASPLENLTGDFGYNWAPSTDVNGGTNTGTIGDRVWVDADGNGVQDLNEVGLAGVTVELFTAGLDGLFGTGDDASGGTRVTDSNGNYIFDGLAADAYEVRVISGVPGTYTQTGDPDHFGTSVGTNDGQTTEPIVLGPGDVFLNADFGYEPGVGDTGSIGDFVWFDANADGLQAGESGIAGVTVSLIQDTDGNGQWDAGEPIIAVDTTDSAGAYLFSGLPTGAADGDYIVWVSDTYNVLSEMSNTNDTHDGSEQTPSAGLVTGLGSSVVTDLTSAGVTTVDFGYTAAGHTNGNGLIGDTIFFDTNRDGTQDAGEVGVEGVVVELYDVTGTTLLETTTTDENGNYYFGSLPVSVAGTSYEVRVAASNFASGAVLEGTANTADPDGGFDSLADTTITTALPTDMAQDFGYAAPNTGTDFGSIGDLVWLDTDGSGAVNGSEAGIDGVTIDLYRDLDGDGIIDPGEPRIGTTTTALGGAYLFDNLPTTDNGAGATGADYIVDVTDTAGLLAGYWHSAGTADTNNNSQTDPYAVSISGASPIVDYADFGYYVEPAVVSNFIWNDLDGDGIQDGGEPGIAGVEVTLQITYPDGTVTTLTEVTDGSGLYSFGNLLLDEDHDGQGGGEPVFRVFVDTPTGYLPTASNVGGDDTTDSDGSGTTATPVLGETVDTYDFGFVGAGAIGNRIWLDENSDGIQDAGEPGIANVEVRLYDSAGALAATTYTDPDGGYLFDSLTPGTYYVDVLDGTGGTTTSMAAGLTQTTPSTLTGGDFGNQDHGTTGIPSTALTGYQVTIGGASPAENLTADFGYNWNPDTDVNGDTNTGAIGDRVWVDSDGDGAQDLNEVGIEGVTVELFTAGADGLFGTGDDASGGTDVTDANGNYIFDGLVADAYQVRVISGVPGTYTQTGDPDHFGTTGAVNDGQTTSPIVLSPGDVFLNADFGYQPGAGDTGSIGDFVWFDANANGVQDDGGVASGIAGVTVSLIQDTDGDGEWDAGEPIIAVDTTDSDGAYLFSGLPTGVNDGDYIVWVSDTDNVLSEMSNTNDTHDGAEPSPAAGLVTGLGSSVITDLTSAGVTDADFGYTAAGHTNGTGLIGDTIFFDTDRSGTQDAGEPGIEGVVVELYDVTGTTLIATTTTDENGNYYFGNLPILAADPDYEVRVAASNFADGAVLEGTTITADPDGGADNLSDATITGAAPTNLDQDFGYAAPNIAGEFGSIGNLVWLDDNADGIFNGTEAGLDGVTIDLYRDLDGDGVIDPGEPRIGTTTTAGGGAYLFANLPTEGDGDADPQAEYIVDVTDVDGVLNAYWHTLGTAGTDGNSQSDPYALEIGSGGGEPASVNLTADFGYYGIPAAIGNYAWYDADGVGDQGGAESPVENVEFTLLVEFAEGSIVQVKTLTDSTGFYSFQQLLTDEDHRGVAISGEPKFTYSAATPAGMVVTLNDVGSDLTDSDVESTVIIDGRLDVDDDGDVDADDDGVIGGVEVIDGRLDLDGDMGITFFDAGDEVDGAMGILVDDGTFEGFAVITGEIDVNASGGVTAADDGLTRSGHMVTAQPVKGQTDVALTNTTDDIASYDAGFSDRDVTVATTCFDYVGVSPFTIGRDTVSHDTGSVLSASGLTLVHTFGSASVTYSGFAASGTTTGTTSCTPAGATVTCTLTGALAPGETWIVDFIVTYPGGANETVSNSASISATEVETDVANNADTCNSTVPVTIARFNTMRDQDRTRFEWTTATEAGNIGFNIYAITENGRELINDRLISTKQFDSTEPQNYAFEVTGVTADRFVIEDVSWNTQTQTHGEFNLGEEYGRAIDVEPIDWFSIREEHVDAGMERRSSERTVAEAAARMLIEAAVEAADLDVESSEAEQQPDADQDLTDDIVNDAGFLSPESILGKGDPAGMDAPPDSAFAKLLVDTDGIHRVTYEDLQLAGYDLDGVKSKDIALLSKGLPVAITVVSGKRFGPGSYIEFPAEATDTLYTKTSTYYLALDKKLAKRISLDRRHNQMKMEPAPYYLETTKVENELRYSFASPNGDPWYEKSMLVYSSPAVWRYGIELDHIADRSIAPHLTVDTWGVTGWPGKSPDHHMLVDFNGDLLATEYFDGLVEHVVDVDLPTDLLKEGPNTLMLTLAGDTGFDFDMVNMDGFSVTYPREFVARDGGLTFDVKGQSIEVTDLDSPDVVVYRIESNRTRIVTSVTTIKQSNGKFTVRFAGDKKSAKYLVSTVDALSTPIIKATRAPVDLIGDAADYVIVTHPSFLTGIQPLVNHHEARGLTVKTVNVLDVFEQYGWGEYGADAIADYLADAHAELGYDYALAVGGDTYDYHGYLGASMSLIPTPYMQTGPFVRFAPVDPKYVDFDGDNVQDAAFGRLPVRTVAELETVVAKTLAYSQKDYDGTAVFAADDNFGQISDELVDLLPSGWDVERAYVDIGGVPSAREALLTALNQGTALTSYMGHSGPTTWTFSGLFNANDAAALTNEGRPTVVTQWGCWNTYHVAPRFNTLGHRFMVEGDRGAAAVLGATTLTQLSSEEKLGALVTPRLVEPGMSIGTAVLDAKRELATTDPDRLDVLLGWSVLGDPAAEVVGAVPGE